MNVDLTIPVHPAAAVFPMLPDEELRQLAEDIKVNGLVHPIVLDTDGQLLDGRNRLAACDLAGVEPSFVTVEVADPLGYVVSQNVNRRHMSKGALAMAITKAKKTGDRSFQGARSELSTLVGVDVRRLSDASVVYKHAPEFVDDVIAGGSLEEAYGIAVGRKQQQEKDLRVLRKLRATYPELAVRVEAGQLTLADAQITADYLDEKQRLGQEIDRVQQRIDLKMDAIERTLTMSLPQATDYAHRRLGPIEPRDPSVAPTRAGDVMDEVVFAIDTASINEARHQLDQLRIVERLLDLIAGNSPQALADGLTIHEAQQMVATLDRVLGWVVEASVALTTLAHGGRLEVVE